MAAGLSCDRRSQSDIVPLGIDCTHSARARKREGFHVVSFAFPSSTRKLPMHMCTCMWAWSLVYSIVEATLANKLDLPLTCRQSEGVPLSRGVNSGQNVRAFALRSRRCTRACRLISAGHTQVVSSSLIAGYTDSPCATKTYDIVFTCYVRHTLYILLWVWEPTSHGMYSPHERYVCPSTFRFARIFMRTEKTSKNHVNVGLQNWWEIAWCVLFQARAHVFLDSSRSSGDVLVCYISVWSFSSLEIRRFGMKSSLFVHHDVRDKENLRYSSWTRH